MKVPGYWIAVMAWENRFRIALFTAIALASMRLHLYPQAAIALAMAGLEGAGFSGLGVEGLQGWGALAAGVSGPLVGLALTVAGGYLMESRPYRLAGFYLAFFNTAYMLIHPVQSIALAVGGWWFSLSDMLASTLAFPIAGLVTIGATRSVGLEVKRSCVFWLSLLSIAPALGATLLDIAIGPPGLGLYILVFDAAIATTAILLATAGRGAEGE